MGNIRISNKMGLGALAFAIVSGAAFAAVPARIERGMYELKSKDGVPKRLCIADAEQLVQLQHPGRQCKRFTIASDARTLTVSYECASGNSGQTTVKVETPRLARVDTQGLLDNMPFNDSYEARRVGDCPS